MKLKKTVKAIKLINLFITLLLLTIVLSLLCAFIFLKKGITIENLTFKGVYVEQLYLKLDNRLHLDIQSLQIQPTRDDGVVDTYYILKTIEYFPHFFHRVNIEHFHIMQEHIEFDGSLRYGDNRIQIDSDLFYLSSSLQVTQDNNLVADPYLHIKDYDFYIYGDFFIDPFSANVFGSGEFTIEGAKGNFDFKRHYKEIQILASTQEFHNLKDIFKKFNLHPTINEWTYENTQAKSYQLDYLYFTHHLDQPLNLYNLHAKATAKDLTISFDPNLPAAKDSKVSLFFHNGKLLFDLHEPSYLGKDLSQSFIYISDLLDENENFIVIDIFAKSAYDKSVEELLKNYNLTLPIKQKDDAEVFANVLVKIGLVKDPEVAVKGTIKTGKTEIALFNYPIMVQEATARFDNDFVYLDHVHIKDSSRELLGSSTIDIESKKIDIEAYVKSFDRYNLFISDLNLHPTITYKDRVYINLSQLGVTVSIDEQQLFARVQDMLNLQNYIPMLQPLKEFLLTAPVRIYSSDMNSFDILAELQLDQEFVLDGGKPVTDIELDANYNHKTGQILFDLDEAIHYNHKERKLFVDNYDLNITSIFDRFELEDIGTKNDSDTFTFEIRGSNNSIIFNELQLLSDSSHTKIEDKDVTFQSKKGDSQIDFAYLNNTISIDAKDLDDSVFHPLTNFKGVEGGNYAFSISGTPQSLQGDISVKGGTLTNLRSYNNLIALINAVPSLALFKAPGFNEEGLTIKDATVEFHLFDDHIYINHLYINGASADIIGFGMIDIKNETIDLDIKVKTIRELGKAISRVPLAGYIIFGEDESLAFTAKVTGDLKNPQVKTQTASGFVKTPFNIIKRTIESPFRFIRQLFE